MRGLAAGVCAVAAVVVVVVLLPANASAAPVPKPCVKPTGLIGDGKHRGTLRWRIAGSNAQVRLTVAVTGTIDLVVGSGTVRQGSGQFRMKALGGGSGVKLSATAAGPLKLGGQTADGFVLTGKVRATGSASSMLTTLSESGGGTVRLSFDIEQANCTSAEGFIDSAFFRDTKTGFSKAGLRANATKAAWTLEAVGGEKELIRKFEQRGEALVAMAASGQCNGLACGRVLPGRIGALIADAKKAENSCVLRLAFDTARRVLQIAIDKGIAEVKRQQQRLKAQRKAGRGINVGNELRVLKDAVRPLLEFSKEIDKIDLGRCSEGLFARITDAYAGAAKHLIDAAVDQRDPVPLLQLGKDVAMAGEVKEGTETVLERLRGFVAQETKEAYERVRRLKRRGNCNPERVKAWNDFRFGAKQLALLGPDTHGDEVAALAPEFARC